MENNSYEVTKVHSHDSLTVKVYCWSLNFLFICGLCMLRGSDDSVMHTMQLHGTMANLKSCEHQDFNLWGMRTLFYIHKKWVETWKSPEVFVFCLTIGIKASLSSSMFSPLIIFSWMASYSRTTKIAEI